MTLPEPARPCLDVISPDKFILTHEQNGILSGGQHMSPDLLNLALVQRLV